jgi:hypothetical protein
MLPICFILYELPIRIKARRYGSSPTFSVSKRRFRRIAIKHNGSAMLSYFVELLVIKNLDLYLDPILAKSPGSWLRSWIRNNEPVESESATLVNQFCGSVNISFGSRRIINYRFGSIQILRGHFCGLLKISCQIL